MMTDQELKEAAIQYIKKCYERNKNTPSLRKIFKHFKKEKLNFTRFYRIFPRGLPEACTFAAVPVPTERMKRTEKATKASKMRGKQVDKDLSEVEDERVKEALTKALEWEKRRDKAKALLEAKRREKEAKLEALKREAELDPKKIPAYLEALDSPLSCRLLRDLHEACRLEKVSLEVGCVKAVEYWDPNARSETKTFEDYVEYCLSEWAWLVRMNNATNKYSGMTFDCCCSECNVKYEYSTYLLDVFKCPNCGNTVHYVCPICKEGWRSEEHLEYDPETNTLHCSWCNTCFNMTPPALKKQGTACTHAYIEKLEQKRRKVLT